MKKIILYITMFLLVCSPAHTDEKLELTVNQFFKTAPVRIYYWSAQWDGSIRYISSNEELTIFSPFKISDQGSIEYHIAKSRFILGNKCYFWWIPNKEKQDYSIEIAGKLEVQSSQGRNDMSSEIPIQSSLIQAQNLCLKYMKLERDYGSALTSAAIGLGMGATYGGLLAAFLLTTQLSPEDFPFYLICGMAGSSLILGVAGLIGLPIINNRMHHVIEELDTLWRLQ